MKAEMIAEQAEQAGMSVPEMEAMAENQRKQMIKAQAEQLGVTPYQFETVMDERKAEAAAAPGWTPRSTRRACNCGRSPCTRRR